MRISNLIILAVATFLTVPSVYSEEGSYHKTEIRTYQMHDYYFDETGRRVKITSADCSPGEPGVTILNENINRQMIGLIRSNAYNDCQNNPPIPEDKDRWERVFCFFVGDVELEDGSASRYCSKNDEYVLFTAYVKYRCDCFAVPVEQGSSAIQTSAASGNLSSQDVFDQ